MCYFFEKNVKISNFATIFKAIKMKKLFVLLLLCFCLIGIGFAQNKNVIDPELYVLMNSRSSD